MAARKPSIAPKSRTPSKKCAPNPIKTRKAKKEKKCKQVFAGLTMSCTGNFGGNWEHEKIRGWIKAHGGDWESDVSDDTTHLICTIEDYKKKTQQGMFGFHTK
jgi:NAD-dependent DNA ligase